MARVHTTRKESVASKYALNARLKRTARLASVDQAKYAITRQSSATAAGACKTARTDRHGECTGGHPEHRHADGKERQMVIADHGEHARLHDLEHQAAHAGEDTPAKNPDLARRACRHDAQNGAVPGCGQQ